MSKKKNLIVTHLVQPLALADNVAFRHTLVAMRPKSTKSDLPTSYNVKLHLHNQFVKHIAQLKLEIKVRSSAILVFLDSSS